MSDPRSPDGNDPRSVADPRSEVERERTIVDTFVALADTLIDEYDVIEFLGVLAERCVDLLDIDEAGIMLVDPYGNLQAIASSSERTRLLELFELQNQEGPCLDAYRIGEMVVSTDLSSDEMQWPTFARSALDNGFAAVVSVPLRLRRTVIGALNLLRNAPGELGEADLTLARALADVATIGLLQERAVRELRTTAGQLQFALTSRVLIEQAKGVIAAKHDVDVDTAFDSLRTYARTHGRKLTELARAVVETQFELPQM